VSGRNLRAIAESKARKSGYPARLALFLESLNDEDRAEVDELLFGEPRLSNAQVADTLMEGFPDHPQILRFRMTDNEVLRWRAKHAS
jgi:hypothetical protein